MEDPMEPFKIVVGIDFSDTSLAALGEALLQASARPRAELHFASVLDGDHAEIMPLEQRHVSLVQLSDELHDRLEALIRTATQRFDPKVPTFIHVRVGPIAEQLAALATELRANLLVVGTHGRRGVKRWVMGSVAEKTVRLAPCPVLVFRPSDFHAMDKVPAIEPACPDCVATRERTHGAQWWCEAHTKEPDLVHIYSRSGRLDQPQNPAPFGSY
jgi:nucleotide-binding universal stress UspA family protein